jgi:hypothetical protein
MPCPDERSETGAQFLPSLPAEALAKVGMVQIFVSITRVAPAPCERSE